MEKLSILETNRFKVNFVQINRKESFHPLVDTYNEIHIIEKIKCSLFFTFLFFFFFSIGNCRNCDRFDLRI